MSTEVLRPRGSHRYTQDLSKWFLFWPKEFLENVIKIVTTFILLSISVIFVK